MSASPCALLYLFVHIFRPFCFTVYCGKAERQNFFEFQPSIMAIFFRFVVVQQQQWWYFWNFLYISQWEGIIGTIYLYISSIPISLKLPPQNRTYVMRETNYVWVYILIGESFFGIVV